MTEIQLQILQMLDEAGGEAFTKNIPRRALNSLVKHGLVGLDHLWDLHGYETSPSTGRFDPRNLTRTRGEEYVYLTDDGWTWVEENL